MGQNEHTELCKDGDATLPLPQHAGYDTPKNALGVFPLLESLTSASFLIRFLPPNSLLFSLITNFVAMKTHKNLGRV